MNIEPLAIGGRLHEALEALRNAAGADTTPWELKKEFQDICNLYDILLDYFRQGVEDPEREHVFTRLIGRTLILSDKLTIASEEGHPDRDSASAFGAATFWGSNEVAEAIATLRAGNAVTPRDAAPEPSEDVINACLLISSMTLSLLLAFDPRKMEVLCEAAASECDDIAVRAVTAIAIALRRYGRRIPFYPDVEARLRLLGTDTAFLDMLADVELQFVRSRDTEQIERRMKDDIIPSMLRSPKAKGKHIITPDDLTDDGNPEWSKWLKDSGLEESLREITELQMNGADIYMATFSQLKRYPFFSDKANWFRPFDPAHPAVSHLFSRNRGTDAKPLAEFSLQSLIMRSGTFCNSDKYSFCLSLASIPQSQLDMLQAQFTEQEEALREELQSRHDRAGKPSSRTLVRQYIQDLYRFFHLCPERKRYADPFADGGSQQPGDELHSFFTLPKSSQLALFELNFQRRDFTSAIDSFAAIEHNCPDALDITLWQKYGFCHQKTGNHAAALHAYRMADLFKPDQYWTLHHIAQCQRALGQTADALESYRHLAAMKPDNPQFAFRQAECLTQLGDYEQALTLLYKLAYDNPDTLRFQRAIIQNLLLLRQPAAAMKYVRRVLDEPSYDLSDYDLTLIGSTQWFCGERDTAIHTLAVSDVINTSTKAGDVPLADTLQQLGIPAADLPFLLDLIRTAKRAED